jgi:hypothetical protein
MTKLKEHTKNELRAALTGIGNLRGRVQSALSDDDSDDAMTVDDEVIIVMIDLEDMIRKALR